MHPARALSMMRPSTRPSFQSLAHGSELRGRVPQPPFVAWTPSGKRWLPFSAAFLLRSVGYLSEDRSGGATSFVRDRVAKSHDALRSGPPAFAGYRCTLAGLREDDALPLPQPSRIRPAARCASLTALVAGEYTQLRPAGTRNNLVLAFLRKAENKEATQIHKRREGNLRS